MYLMCVILVDILPVLVIGGPEMIVKAKSDPSTFEVTPV